jgi:enoyl-CoA hydratase
MMNSPTVELAHRDLIATITITRLAQQNALDAATLAALLETFTKLKHDADTRVIILTGAGNEAFSASSAETTFTPEQASEHTHLLQTLTSLIEDLGKPVIAAINGSACGSGCELASACTWRIAVAHAQFAWPEARLGISSGTIRLARVIGKARALELLLTDAPIDAAEALGIGLVNRVAKDQSELLTICYDLATQISRNAPLAVKYALAAVNHGSTLPLSEGLELESSLFAHCFATDDAREGTQAFLEKRAPVFKGQ